MSTLSAPTVTSSPIATPSWMRTCPRMSHERPRIAPSTIDARPMCVEASITERVKVRLAVLVEVADVLPVAVHREAEDRSSHLEQQREKLLREVVRLVGWNVAQHFRLEHVDAGVDRVGEHLAPGRLLEESLDPALLVGDDDAELERVVHGLEPDRHRGLAFPMELDQRREVEVTEGVAGDDEEGLVEPARG